ncbi:MAG TPA: MmcQ/YjbR family DNA-binding protein [Vicinamibacterales bacterium]|nr:MmcQ/YjbR family DNA-binding protein [Vicinamibacterales bacterium]
MLPETTETSSWNHPNFRAGRKTFCTFEMVNDRPSIAFRVSAVDAAAALRRKQFFATPYGRGLWVSVWVDGQPDWTLIGRLIERSYRLVASKRLAKALDAMS